jgi:hypothetical protein
MKYLIPVLAAIALAGPLAAADKGDQEKVSANAGEAPDSSQNRMICKRQKVSGSRLKANKVCMTEAQWAQMKRENREATERTQAARWKSE